MRNSAESATAHFWDHQDDMKQHGMSLALRFAKVGLIVAFSMALATALLGNTFPGVFSFLWAPADWVATLWSETLQLPPRNELGYGVVYLAGFVQWFGFGALVASWWHWINHADDK